jgi:hypothetical protein
MRLLVELAGWKEREVARRFGLNDSSVVSHHLKSWQQQYEASRPLMALEDTLRKQWRRA